VKKSRRWIGDYHHRRRSYKTGGRRRLFILMPGPTVETIRVPFINIMPLPREAAGFSRVVRVRLNLLDMFRRTCYPLLWILCFYIKTMPSSIYISPSRTSHPSRCVVFFFLPGRDRCLINRWLVLHTRKV